LNSSDSYEKIVKGEGDDSRLVDWRALREYSKALFLSQGMPDEDAATVADCLVDAELCGVPSHGVSRLTIYLKRLECGVVSKTFTPTIEKEYPSSVLLNANNANGMVVGKYAMELACRKAAESGSCFVFVNHSNHLGMMGYYPRLAAARGMVGFVTTSANPGIAPFGSSKPFLGTSPIAIAAPGKNDPVVLDMAPSVVAMGKVMLSMKLGVDIPEGWAMDENGKPTTDAKAASKGSVLPIGGPKGSGLSLFSQILGGIVSGAQYGPHVNTLYYDFENPQGMGHMFAAIDISKIIDLDTFKDGIERLTGEIKGLPRVEGVDEIFLPGEIEMRRRRQRETEGIHITGVVYRELTDLGKRYDVPFTL
jgi:LDH2 family malate/lactate/ureidoglycolate dehydrogenase